MAGAKTISVTTDTAARKAVRIKGAHRVRSARGGIDIPGLYLRVQKPGAASWALRSTIGRKPTWLGLGRWPDIPLAKARELAQEARTQIAEGKDPRELKKAAASALSLSTWAEASHAAYDHNRPRWRDEKIARLFISRLDRHTFPAMGDVPVANVTPDILAAAIKPIWAEKHDIARKILRYSADVLAWATITGRRDHPDSVAKTIEQTRAILGPVSREAKTSKSHLALPFADVPLLLDAFDNSASMPTAKLLLRWTALSACRSMEAREAMWGEVNEAEGVWRIPAFRMKSRRAHEVPLTSAMSAILSEARDFADGSGLIFPGLKAGKPISDASIPKTLNSIPAVRQMIDKAHPPAPQADGSLKPHRLGVHWLRAAFRTWALAAGEDRQIVELALAHVIPGTEGRYVREDDPQLFERRRLAMERWAGFVSGEASGDVLNFAKRAV